jgi:O-glycosyl hydrolase
LHFFYNLLEFSTLTALEQELNSASEKKSKSGKEIIMRVRFRWVMALLLILSIFVPAYSIDVTVDGAVRYQTIEGFGTCLIAWSERFRELYRTEEFQRIYVEGVGCNMLRVNMWGPTFEKPTEDWRQIRCEDFNMEANGGRPRIFVDFGRGILKINPEIKIIGTVWSPPAWMKMNKSITDKRSNAIRAGVFQAVLQVDGGVCENT